MLKQVEIPKHVRKGLQPMTKDHPLSHNLRVFGSDTETVSGQPMTLQIAGPDIDGKEDEYFVYVDKETVFPEFWRWIRGRLRPGGVNICYFHKLNFDLRVLFRMYLKEMYAQNNDIAFDILIDNQTLDINILFGKVNTATILLRGERTRKSEPGPVIARLKILDSIAFTQASLERSLKMFGVPQDKLKHPEGLGSINFGSLPPTDPRRIEFEEYSKQDARAERHLGLKIMDFHALYHVSPSISLPSYAAKVFRRHFLRAGECIPFPPDDVVKAAEKSYHGGKNGFYLDAPQSMEDLCEVDINSAYPHAMRELPEITKGIYMKVNEFKKDAVGIYCVSGLIDERHPKAKYRLVFDHAFKPIRDRFTKVWNTCYEVEAMMASPVIRITDIEGFIWRPGVGGSNPFRRFVDHFYEKKENTPKADPHYHFYKIVLNALYGKLVSTIEVRSAEGEDEIRKLREMGVDMPSFIRIDERFDKVLQKNVSIARAWRAGSMYNPFLASLITGHARRYLYELESDLNAVHSATDSVKTRQNIEAQKGLGGLKVECRGRCYLFRNKLYLHFSKDAQYCGHTSPPFKYPPKMNIVKDGRLVTVPHPKAGQSLVDHDGQHLCKVALHGFKGPVWFLFEQRHALIADGELTYLYTHVVGLREGLRRGATPCDFIPVTEKLSLLKPYEQDHLISFIIKHGGFNPDRERGGYEAEINALAYKETRLRGLISDRGMSADHMRETCAESQYIYEDMELSEFMALVRDCAMSGRKHYGLNDTGERAGDILFPEPGEETL